jgi:hypothetical protein
MKSREFWRAVTVDETDFLGRLLAVLDGAGIRYCVIGGQAVNAYVEPLVSLDLDLAIAAEDLPRLSGLLGYEFEVERFEHTWNLRRAGSDLRAQIQLDPRYAPFVERAQVRTVLGRDLPVASLEDVLEGKIWAASDPARRPSKRQKDLADLARLLERFPVFADRVPATLRAKLV